MSETRSESIIFIDDEEEVRRANAQSLDLAGFEVQAFASAEAARPLITPDFPGIVVSDVRLRGTDGLALLAEIAESDADLPVILITGHGDIPMAVEAMRRGAYDFIEKPYPADRLIESVRRALEKRRLVMENRALRAELAQLGEDAALLGRTPAMDRLRRTILDLAAVDVDVLVTGETGSGKEVVATAIHHWAPHRRGRFVAVNCAGLPEAGVESELFGHEMGAFSGAVRRRIGRIEHADGGTLFLDAIESMPLTLQAKLLRMLQERAVEPLGANEARPLSLRVIAASRADLEQAVARREFREDLYYRLNVVTLRVPPLRDRRDDIPLLFAHFAGRAARRFSREPPAMTPELMRFLLGHAWPGNVRELRHFAERLVLGLAEELRAAPGAGADASLAQQVDGFERALILRELAASRGDVKAATEALRIPRKTLYDKLARHGIDPKAYR